VIATREGPDITVKVRKKFDDDGIGGLRNEIALSNFEFVALEGPCFGQKLIACAGSEHEKVRGAPLAFDGVAGLFARSVHGDDMRAVYLAASVLRSFKQQTIQHHARINDDGVAHLEFGALFVAGDEFDRVDELFGIGIIEKKWKPLNGFVSEAAAAGFLPCEMLVKNVNSVAGAGELFATHRSRRSAADDYDFSHAFARYR